MNISLSCIVASCYLQIAVTAKCYIWDTPRVLYLSQEKKNYKPTAQNFLLDVILDMIWVIFCSCIQSISFTSLIFLSTKVKSLIFLSLHCR